MKFKDTKNLLKKLLIHSLSKLKVQLSKLNTPQTRCALKILIILFISVILALLILTAALVLAKKYTFASNIAGPFSSVFALNIYSYKISENFSLQVFGFEVLAVFFVFYVLPIFSTIILKNEITKIFLKIKAKHFKLMSLFILLNLIFTFIYMANRESFSGLARKDPPNKTEHLISLIKELETKISLKDKLQKHLTKSDSAQLVASIEDLNQEIVSVYNEDIGLNSCVACVFDSKVKTIRKINKQFYVTDEKNSFIEIFKYSFMTSIGQPPSEVRPIDSTGIIINFIHLFFVFFILVNAVNSYIQDDKS